MLVVRVSAQVQSGADGIHAGKGGFSAAAQGAEVGVDGLGGDGQFLVLHGVLGD